MKVISNQLNPHFQFRDAAFSFFQSWKIFHKKNLNFHDYFGTHHYALFNSARSGLGTLIQLMGLPKNKTIALPAFCCAVMATPFLKAGYKIEWIDTDENGLMDLSDFKKKSDEIGLLVLPYIFGQHPDFDAFYDYASKKNIFVVKDGAHNLNVKTHNCDAVLLSFGREKAVSCISGGALILKDESPLSLVFSPVKKGLGAPSIFWTLQHLWQPTFFWWGLTFWSLSWKNKQIPFGKAFLYTLGRMRIFPRAVSPLEKKGHEDLPIKKLPIPMQHVLLNQLEKNLDREALQTENAQTWSQWLPKVFPDNRIIIPPNGLRLIMICKTKEQKQKIIDIGKTKNVLLRDWDGSPIAPKGTHLEAFGYTPGLCPKAEDYAEHFLTFPTNPWVTPSDIKRFCTTLKTQFYGSN